MIRQLTQKDIEILHHLIDKEYVTYPFSETHRLINEYRDMLRKVKLHLSWLERDRANKDNATTL